MFINNHSKSNLFKMSLLNQCVYYIHIYIHILRVFKYKAEYL